VFTGEPLRGVRFNIEDLKLHNDSAHRRPQQLVPAMRRAMQACEMRGKPTLMEPIYRCSVTVPQSAMEGVYTTLRQRRAKFTASPEESKVGNLLHIDSFLPVAESFGFTELLRKNTGGQAFPQMIFSHWAQVSGDLTDPTSRATEVMMAIRKRKGMKSELPVFEDYHDKI